MAEGCLSTGRAFRRRLRPAENRDEPGIDGSKGKLMRSDRIAAAALLFAATAMAQQGPAGRTAAGPRPGPGGRARRGWNERVSAGPPVGAMREFEGWSMGAAMPLPRSEHAVAELDGRIWVLGGYPPGPAPVQPRPDLRSGREPLVARPAPAPADPPHPCRGGRRQALHARRRDRRREHRDGRDLRGERLDPRSGGRRLGQRARRCRRRAAAAARR